MNPAIDSGMRDRTLVVIGLLTAFSTIASLALLASVIWQ
jgi:hypothetical protein